MKKTILILFCLCWIFQLKAQIIPHKTSFYVGYSHPSFGNNEYVNIKGFIAPSLLTNFQNLRGYSLKLAYRKSDHISLALGFQQISGYNWKLGAQTDFIGASQEQYALTPMLTFTSKQKSLGLFNRMIFFVEIAPVVGFSILQSPEPLFEIRPRGTALFQTSRDYFWGIHAAAGAEFNLTKGMGLYAKYSVQANWTDPIAHNDKQSLLRQINMGIFFRLSYDKNFLYK